VLSQKQLSTTINELAFISDTSIFKPGNIISLNNSQSLPFILYDNYIPTDSFPIYRTLKIHNDNPVYIHQYYTIQQVGTIGCIVWGDIIWGQIKFCSVPDNYSILSSNPNISSHHSHMLGIISTPPIMLPSSLLKYKFVNKGIINYDSNYPILTQLYVNNIMPGLLTNIEPDLNYKIKAAIVIAHNRLLIKIHRPDDNFISQYQILNKSSLQSINQYNPISLLNSNIIPAQNFIDPTTIVGINTNTAMPGSILDIKFNGKLEIDHTLFSQHTPGLYYYNQGLFDKIGQYTDSYNISYSDPVLLYLDPYIILNRNRTFNRVHTTVPYLSNTNSLHLEAEHITIQGTEPLLFPSQRPMYKNIQVNTDTITSINTSMVRHDNSLIPLQVIDGNNKLNIHPNAVVRIRKRSGYNIKLLGRSSKLKITPTFLSFSTSSINIYPYGYDNEMPIQYIVINQHVGGTIYITESPVGYSFILSIRRTSNPISLDINVLYPYNMSPVNHITGNGTLFNVYKLVSIGNNQYLIKKLTTNANIHNTI